MAKAVAKKENQAPDFIRQTGRARGMESVDAQKITSPRIELMPASSPEVVDGDAEPGEFVHNLSGDNFGEEVEIIPILVKERYVLWNPRHDGGGILARAEDGVHWDPADGEFEVKPIKGSKQKAVWKTAPTVKESGLHLWGSSVPDDKDSPPAATFTYVVLCYLPEYPELSPVVLYMQRGHMKVAKKFVGRLIYGQHDTFAKAWTVKAQPTQNIAGDDYLTYAFASAGFVQDEEIYRRCESIYENFSKSDWAVADEERAQPQDSGEDADAAAKKYDV